jgi:hypothetical protein
VEEWTRAETGVGAAIAAGSQAEKGTWALFVILAAKIPRSKTLLRLYPLSLNLLNSAPNLPHAALTLSSKKMSPKRLERRVRRPAFRDLSLKK